MAKLKIGVIGLGRIGKVHLENLVLRLPQTKVLAASDIDPSSHSFATNLGVPIVTTSPEEILTAPEIDAVIICSPTFTHQDYCLQAAEHGKHIFCEKPLETTLEKIRIIRDFVNARGIKLQVGFNRRFDRHFARIQQVVKSGKIGDQHILKITSRDPMPPPIEFVRGSGGKFMDMTIHDFDMTRFISGSEVEEVYARGANLIDPQIGEAGDIDTSVISLKLTNGALGTIDNSRKAVYGYDQRLEIFGSQGMTKIDNVREDNHQVFGETGSQRPRLLHFFMERFMESYYEELLAFVKAVRTNKPVPVDAHDALMATAIALAANLSMTENRTVRLSEVLNR